MRTNKPHYDPLISQLNAYAPNQLENISKKLTTRERDIVMKAMSFRDEDRSVIKSEIDNLVTKLKTTSTEKLTKFEKVCNTVNYLATSLFPNYINSKDLSKKILEYKLHSSSNRNEILEKAEKISHRIVKNEGPNQLKDLDLALAEHEKKKNETPIQHTDKKILIYLNYNIPHLKKQLESGKLTEKQTEKTKNLLTETYEDKMKVLRELIAETERKQSKPNDSAIQSLRKDWISTLDALKSMESTVNISDEPIIVETKQPEEKKEVQPQQTNKKQSVSMKEVFDLAQDVNRAIVDMEGAIKLNRPSMPANDMSELTNNLAGLYRQKLTLLDSIKFDNNPKMSAYLQKEKKLTREKLNALPQPTKVGRNPRVLPS